MAQTRGAKGPVNSRPPKKQKTNSSKKRSADAPANNSGKKQKVSNGAGPLEASEARVIVAPPRAIVAGPSSSRIPRNSWMNAGRIPAMVKGLGNTYVHTLVPGNNTLEAKRKAIIYKLKANKSPSNGPSFRNQFENQWRLQIPATKPGNLNRFGKPTRTKKGACTAENKRFYESFMTVLNRESERLVNKAVESVPKKQEQTSVTPATKSLIRRMLNHWLHRKAVVQMGPATITASPQNAIDGARDAVTEFPFTAAQIFAQPLFLGSFPSLAVLGIWDFMRVVKGTLNGAARHVNPAYKELFADFTRLIRGYFSAENKGKWGFENMWSILTVTGMAVALVVAGIGWRQFGGLPGMTVKLIMIFGGAAAGLLKAWIGAMSKEIVGLAIAAKEKASRAVLAIGREEVAHTTGGYMTMSEEEWDLGYYIQITLQVTQHMLFSPEDFNRGFTRWAGLILTGLLATVAVSKVSGGVRKWRNGAKVRALRHSTRLHQKEQNKQLRQNENKRMKLLAKLNEYREEISNNFEVRGVILKSSESQLLNRDISRMNSVGLIAYERSLDALWNKYK